MECPNEYCSGRHSQLEMMSEREVSRMLGSNYDIVIYEKEVECPRCGYATWLQDEPIRECTSVDDYMSDGTNLMTTPNRFGT